MNEFNKIIGKRKKVSLFFHQNIFFIYILFWFYLNFIILYRNKVIPELINSFINNKKKDCYYFILFYLFFKEK